MVLRYRGTGCTHSYRTEPDIPILFVVLERKIAAPCTLYSSLFERVSRYIFLPEVHVFLSTFLAFSRYERPYEKIYLHYTEHLLSVYHERCMIDVWDSMLSDKMHVRSPPLNWISYSYQTRVWRSENTKKKKRKKNRTPSTDKTRHPIAPASNRAAPHRPHRSTRYILLAHSTYTPDTRTMHAQIDLAHSSSPPQDESLCYRSLASY